MPQQRSSPVAILALAKASLRVALEYNDVALAEHAVKRWREARTKSPRLFRMPRRSAERHAALPILLTQALQAGSRDLSLSTTAGRAGPIFKLTHRDRRAAMKQPGEHSGASVDFEIADGVSYAVGMPERYNLAGIGVTNFVDAGTDRRLDELAIVRVRKLLPGCPGLHHAHDKRGSFPRHRTSIG